MHRCFRLQVQHKDGTLLGYVRTRVAYSCELFFEIKNYYLHCRHLCSFLFN